MITDYYGDGNRYRGVTSRGGKTRTIVIAGNAVLHDTANDREDADHNGKETRTMRKPFKFDATKLEGRKMTEPALEADGRCSACRGRLCEYHQLEGIRRDRAQSAMLREVAATIRFRNLPDDGCDLNHNEDNPRTHR